MQIILLPPEGRAGGEKRGEEEQTALQLGMNKVKSFRFTSDVVGGSGGRGPGRVLGRGALRLRGAGSIVVIVRLLCTVIQHEGLGLMGDGDGAGTLGPRLPVHLHGHLGALEKQLQRDQ